MNRLYLAMNGDRAVCTFMSELVKSIEGMEEYTTLVGGSWQDVYKLTRVRSAPAPSSLVPLEG